MLENGLDEASCVVPSDTPPSLSPDPMPYLGPPEEEEHTPAAPDQGVAEATDSEEQPAAGDEDMKDNAQMANFAKIAQIPIETFGLRGRRESTIAMSSFAAVPPKGTARLPRFVLSKARLR